jgi:hypothetical protein
MVRHQEHLAAQPCAQAIDQCRLLCGLDIATEQQSVPALAMHAQHAAQRVGPRRRHVVTGQRMQQLEAHAVPSPGRACGAAAVRRAAGQQRMRLGQRTGQSVHRHFVQQRRRPADMGDVAVAEHQQVHAAFAARAQQRQQHALRGVRLGRITRPGVVQQQAVAGAHQHRRALADVGGNHLELAHGRPRQWRRP